MNTEGTHEPMKPDDTSEASKPNDYSTVQADFEASIRFLSASEGGRKTTWVTQGYRPDFSYKGELDSIFMIWPLFLDEHGKPLLERSIVYTDAPVTARMVIINPDLRSEHRGRLKIGSEFYIREGSRIVAEGVVTRILDLHKD